MSRQCKSHPNRMDAIQGLEDLILDKELLGETADGMSREVCSWRWVWWSWCRRRREGWRQRWTSFSIRGPTNIHVYYWFSTLYPVNDSLAEDGGAPSLADISTIKYWFHTTLTPSYTTPKRIPFVSQSNAFILHKRMDKVFIGRFLTFLIRKKVVEEK